MTVPFAGPSRLNRLSNLPFGSAVSRYVSLAGLFRLPKRFYLKPLFFLLAAELLLFTSSFSLYGVF